MSRAYAWIGQPTAFCLAESLCRDLVPEKAQVEGRIGGRHTRLGPCTHECGGRS